MRGSVDYVNNVFGDGAYNYSLIDIPTLANLQDASGNWGAGDWTFKDFTGKDAENNTMVTDSGADQAKDLWDYIQKDKYLRTHTGKIAERNSLVGPWVNRIDLKFNQNFYFYTGANKHRHTVQIGVDVLNVANLLNPHWGNAWTVNAGDGYGNAIPINLTNAKDVYTAGANPVFQFQKNGSEKLTDIFSIYNSTSSTWQMILSARYIF